MGVTAALLYSVTLLPALLAIGLMNFAMVGTAASVARYRELKILKRIVVTPLPTSRFIFGQVGARLVLAAVQTALIMLVGLLVGGSLGSGWPLLFVISTLGNLIFLSLGFAIAGRVGSVDAANNMAGLATTPLMFLSGSFFPIESMPGWLQPIADLLPLTEPIQAEFDQESCGEEQFLAAMVSFYDPSWGEELAQLIDCDKSFAGLTYNLDHGRIEILCELLRNYQGWPED